MNGVYISLPEGSAAAYTKMAPPDEYGQSIFFYKVSRNGWWVLGYDCDGSLTNAKAEFRASKEQWNGPPMHYGASP